jgi:L-amino acid N-acyltransferase YncA
MESPPPIVAIRPAVPADIPQINAIYSHYILHTSITFVTVPFPDNAILARYSSIVKQQHLPFLVATIPGCASDRDREDVSDVTDDIVTGYAYAGAYRADHAAYGHTVEMTILVHPNHHSRGVGSALISRLIAELLHNPRDPQAPVITEVLACMAVDIEGPRRGQALRDWYLRRGFIERGRLEKIGWKRGRW